MQLKVYKNDSGYIVTYPRKAIYALGSRVPNSVLVVGRGPTVAGDPSSTTDQVFNAEKLGTEVAPTDVPTKWREPLGLPVARKLKQVVKPRPTRSRQEVYEEKMNFSDLKAEATAKVVAWGFFGGCIGLMIQLIQYLVS